MKNYSKIDYQYDSANRFLVAETNPAYLQVSYHYDGTGRLLDRILSNGARTRYGWDVAGRLTQLSNTTVTGQLINNTSYTRDRLANILTQTEAARTGQSAGTTIFSYDPEYRLLSADYPGTANDESFTYDKVGNRKTHAQAEVAVHYFNVNAGNRLTDMRTGSATGTILESYLYDDNGSLTGISGNRALTLSWDANNRVKQTGTTTYQYDPSDYRIKKTGTATKNYYLEGEHLEAIYNNTGVVQAQYFRGSLIDEVLNGYQKDSNGKLINFTYHHDALQSVLGQSGHEGSILSTQNYSAFGKTLSQTGTSSNAQKYTGREQDNESGFYYYRARYYDPVTGRFISEDPKGFAAGVNFYAYCSNSPVNCNDPSGNVANFVAAGGGAIIGGIAGAGTAYLKSGGDWNATLKGGLTGAAFGAWTGATFGANLVPSGAALGVLSAAGGNAFGQFFGSKGLINLTEVSVSGALGAIPGSIQSALINDAVISGVGQNAINTAAGLGLVGQWKLAGEALGQGISPALPSYNVNLSSTYNQVQQFTNSVTTSISSFLNNASANAGFVIYPNKSNTNQMQSVYKK